MTRLQLAIDYAARMHEGQIRKLSHVPYILHPMEAAAVAASLTDDEDVIIAALLHDVLEDTDATEEEVEELFGKRVLALVKSETENKRKDQPASVTWKIRKQESLDELAKANREEKIVWLSDKLSNMRALSKDYVLIGNRVFEAFNERRKAQHEWYYRSILGLLESELGDTFAYLEYKQLVYLVFKGEPQ